MREVEIDWWTAVEIESEVVPVDTSPVLTAEEAAALLRVSTKTLLREARDGRVPGQKIGRSWRFSRHELLARLSATQVEDA